MKHCPEEWLRRMGEPLEESVKRAAERRALRRRRQEVKEEEPERKKSNETSVKEKTIEDYDQVGSSNYSNPSYEHCHRSHGTGVQATVKEEVKEKDFRSHESPLVNSEEGKKSLHKKKERSDKGKRRKCFGVRYDEIAELARRAGIAAAPEFDDNKEDYFERSKQLAAMAFRQGLISKGDKQRRSAAVRIASMKGYTRRSLVKISNVTRIACPEFIKDVEKAIFHLDNNVRLVIDAMLADFARTFGTKESNSKEHLESFKAFAMRLKSKIAYMSENATNSLKELKKYCSVESLNRNGEAQAESSKMTAERYDRHRQEVKDEEPERKKSRRSGEEVIKEETMEDYDQAGSTNYNDASFVDPINGHSSTGTGVEEAIVKEEEVEEKALSQVLPSAEVEGTTHLREDHIKKEEPDGE